MSSVIEIEPTEIAKQQTEFLKSLREETLHHKEKRAEFVLRKLAFVATLLGLGSVEIKDASLYWLLYIVPLVAIAYDVYISAEDYKVKRIGAYHRVSKYPHPSEKEWEEFVNKHREAWAAPASLGLTLVAIIASITVIAVKTSVNFSATSLISAGSLFLLAWAVFSFVLMIFVSHHYKQLVDKLPQG